MIIDVLIATVPWRRQPCARLLGDIQKQSLQPRFVHLVLDGYGDDSLPRDLPLPIRICEYRTAKPSGPGGRWRVLREGSITGADVLVVFDDDQILMGPTVIENFVRVIGDGATAYRGTDLRGSGGCVFPEGRPLICMGAGAMAVHPADLAGLDEMRAEIQTKCGFDPFADGGDDQAVVSAHLWRKGVPMRAAGFLEIFMQQELNGGSQQEKRRSTKGTKSFFWQSEAIRAATGWPWPNVNG